MSERPVRILLEDILDAAGTALAFTLEVDYATFIGDRMRKDAVFRNLEVLGEAVNKLPTAYMNNHPEVEWHKPIGMRNRLIHAYFDVDNSIVFHTVKSVLPGFIDQVEKLLATETDN